MKITDLKRKINELVGNGHLKEAIDMVLSEVLGSGDNDLENEIIVIRGRYGNLNAKINSGQISSAEEAIEINKICEGLLRYVDAYEQFFFNIDIQHSSEATQDLRAFVRDLRSNNFILSNKDRFVQDLESIFEQIEKAYTVIHSIIIKFIEPVFQPSIEPGIYLTYERGGAYAEINNGRGHCSIIFDHYYHGIRTILIEKLGSNSKEYLELDRIFSGLGHADIEVFDQMATIGSFIQTESEKIVDFLSTGRQDEARNTILMGRKKLKDLENALETGLGEIQEFRLKLGYKI